MSKPASPYVLLRQMTPEEAASLKSDESPFDDFGPRAVRTEAPSNNVHESGGLAVESDGTLVGEVEWHWGQWGPPPSRHIMIGISLRESAWNRGIGTEAQRSLVELLFRHTRTNRIEALTDVENKAEQKALERAGFQQEGIVRGGQWRNGAWRDGYLYSVLRSDWERATVAIP